MYIDHIKTFLEVTSTGSFLVAAGNLCVTQSTVSARIKALEAYLNRSLFVRKRSGVELTSGGRLFHPHALTVVRAWERARQAVALPEDLSAIVNLGVQLNHWEHIAAPWLVWMDNNAPDVATKIISEYSDSLMRQVRDGTLELAILYEPQHCAGVVIKPFATEKLLMVSTSPRQLEEGQVSGYVFVDWGGAFRTQHSLAFPGTSAHRLTVRLGAVGLEHILKHRGSGYFLEKSVQPLIDEGRLYLIEEAPVFERPLFLVYQQDMQEEIVLQTAMSGLWEVLRNFPTPDKPRGRK